MCKAKPDPGATTDHELNYFGRQIYFVNGFAANDPESTERIWNMAIERYPESTGESRFSIAGPIGPIGRSNWARPASVGSRQTTTY